MDTKKRVRTYDRPSNHPVGSLDHGELHNAASPRRPVAYHEQKRHKGWIALLVGLVVLGLIAWGIAEMFEDDEAEVDEAVASADFDLAEEDEVGQALYPPVIESDQTPQRAAQNSNSGATNMADRGAGANNQAQANVDPRRVNLPLAQIARTPERYVGHVVGSTAQVGQVISDRGFWLEQDGQRIFALIDEEGREVLHISEGQRVAFAGEVASPEVIETFATGLDRDSVEAARGEPFFLTIESDNINILER